MVSRWNRMFWPYDRAAEQYERDHRAWVWPHGAQPGVLADPGPRLPSRGRRVRGPRLAPRGLAEGAFMDQPVLVAWGRPEESGWWSQVVRVESGWEFQDVIADIWSGGVSDHYYRPVWAITECLRAPLKGIEVGEHLPQRDHEGRTVASTGSGCAATTPGRWTCTVAPLDRPSVP